MKKIKIAIIVTKLELGGAQKVAIAICEKLNKEIFEPFLICGCGGILDEEVQRSIKVYFVKSLVREINPIKDIKAFFEIKEILKREQPDIVHTHSSKAGILGRFAAKYSKIKKIVHTIHGFGFNDNQGFLKKKLFVLLEKYCAKISNYLIPVSVENIKKGLKNNIGYKEQYRYIKLGVDIDNFKNFKGEPSLKKELNIKDDDVIVTTIGPFKPQKNLQDFIKVASKLSKINNKFKFVIVGDGTLRPIFEKMIKEYNICDNIFLLGWRRDISNILHSSDIFAMTSLWEGLPISTIEAMCCGLAPVVNDVDGQKEIVKDNINGFLIKPYDIENMSEKILLLCENKNLRIDMGKAAKETIDETFSINYMITEHEKLYMDMLK